jgi:23S rRNA (guanosine2251-2'-O)-methyltransferase
MEFVYGHWAVHECLKARRRKVENLLLADRTDERDKKVAEVLELAKMRGVPVQRVQRRILDDLSNNGNHQGMALRVSDYPYVEVEAILKVAHERGERPFLLLLDHLEDPQNIGTLMRVADAVGIHGIVMPERRSASITPAVVRASSGAVEHLHIAQVVNLVQTMKKLKEHDVWLVGMDTGDDVPFFEPAQLNMAIGLVMGSEGKGISKLVRETCDLLMKLPMRGHVESLNVATAGAVALYGAWQARGYGSK